MTNLNALKNITWTKMDILLNLNLIICCTFLMYFYLSVVANLFFTPLYCDSPHFHAFTQNTPENLQAYNDWWNSLTEEELMDLIDSEGEDDLALYFEFYGDFRYKLFWDELTPEQQKELYDADPNNTRIYGTIFMITVIIIAIFVE